ncbi:FG-GAP repeat-containing protein [Hyalomma marginatum]|uniref:FG-GAP repeat-containing protein n=1 Tax=Hyalomma marginatum TaxID=34627 RepID=A0A8S4BVI5_9ACAR|nr:FG-GAP repeat-containing protein [Hyalomma marginatum]
MELRDLNGSNGFIIVGASAGATLGESLFAASDMNGDGKNDIIICAPNSAPDNRGSAGQVYVIFG